MSVSAINKLVTKVAANPGRAIATVSAAVPVVVEKVIAVAPVAIVGAAGYGVYRLIKAAAK